MKIATLVILTLLATPTISATTAARAEVQYPWCAEYRAPIGATNCGFMTYQQCLDTISGVGGICIRNAAYRPPAKRNRSR